MPSYKVSFPDIEVNAPDGYHARLEAIKELKRKDKDFDLLPYYDIKWTETHTDECDCNNCKEERS